jgi:TPP-dependent pyruvate/acetoin dehydrogenase alpha subunit
MLTMLLKRVEVVKEIGWRKGTVESFDGTHYRYLKVEHLYETKEDAIAAGRAKLEAQRAKTQKQLDGIEKRAKNLDKAEAKLAECAE